MFSPPISVVTDHTFIPPSAPQMPSAASSSNAIACPAVPVVHPASPPPVHENLRLSYSPPTQTTTRSGRISHPAARFNL